MIESLELSLLIGAGLVLLSVLVSPLATRLGAPILLVFLGIGMLVGQDGPGGFEFNEFNYGDTLPFTLFCSGLMLSVCLGFHASSFPASPPCDAAWEQTPTSFHEGRRLCAL
jgi:NhaP-type Na+/H+ and K+/H+ antiporter